MIHPKHTSRTSRFISVFVAISIAFMAAAPLASAADNSPIDLAAYAALLETHTQSTPDIVGTRVDYKSLKKAPELKSLVAQVKQAKPSTLDRNGKLAFWINAYNILAIDLVAKNYPIESIKDIGSFFSPVWDVEVAKIEGTTYSLGSIEHEILRKMGEPRIHAAIICASVSCPPLARTPFTAETLETDLNAAMQSWLTNDEKGIKINRSARSVRISKIFDWFEEDFEAKGGALKSIAPHVSDSDAAWLAENGKNATISYFGYDWSLNEVK